MAECDYTIQTIAPHKRKPVSEEVKANDRKRQAAYRAENRYGSSTEASIRSQHMKRVRALMLLGGKCAECDNNDMRTLHFDHINNDGNVDRKQNGRTVVKQVFKNPNRFQILCANCHEIKHSIIYTKEV